MPPRRPRPPPIKTGGEGEETPIGHKGDDPEHILGANIATELQLLLPGLAFHNQITQRRYPDNLLEKADNPAEKIDGSGKSIQELFTQVVLNACRKKHNELGLMSDDINSILNKNDQTLLLNYCF
ncbi:MAG: hypothetical protein AAF195_04470 [Pseudomonadota bacterium]